MKVQGVARPGGNSKFHKRELPATWAPFLPGKFSFFFLLDILSNWDYHILILLECFSTWWKMESWCERSFPSQGFGVLLLYGFSFPCLGF